MLSQRVVLVALLAVSAIVAVNAANRINVNFANLLSDVETPMPAAEEQTVVLPDPTQDGVSVNFAYMMNGVKCQQSAAVPCDTENAYDFTAVHNDPYWQSMPGLCRWSAEPGRHAACVRPAGNLDVSIEVKNTGVAKWLRGEVTLQLGGEETFNYPYWQKSTLILSEDVSAGEVAIFRGVLKAPSTIGVFYLDWQGVGPCGRFGNVTGTVEVTCSDGIFCNGMERFINNKCMPSSWKQCDDHTDCTEDTCDEDAQTCSHKLISNAPGCTRCNATGCVPECKEGQECGGDGCGGICGKGSDCGDGKACDANLEVPKCVVPSNQGSCSDPIPLIPKDQGILGRITMQIDNSKGYVDEITPTCNTASTAPEIVYFFDVPAGMTVGIDARMYNAEEERDTLLELRFDQCRDKLPGEKEWEETGPNKNVWCSDDATPPGHFGARIAALLHPGRYYLAADAYSIENVGTSTLDVKFVNGYVPQCLSRYCGPDGGGGDCGPCGDDQVCSERKQCIPATCNDADRCLIKHHNETTGEDEEYQAECGYDKCERGGRCGSMNGNCPEGLFCVQDLGKCLPMPVCNHLVPTCSNCNDNQFCGVDCQCHDREDRWADLVIDKAELMNSILWDHREFDNVSCAVVEQCVEGTGVRRLMKFGVAVANIGNAALEMPSPHTRPDEFIFATCHNHYHYNGFAQYRLLNNEGQVIRRGHKQAYCLEDSTQYEGQEGPGVPCRGSTGCENPGLSQGWFDTYGNDLDCQWIDITGVEPGQYILRVDINTARQMQESTYENNSVEIEVTIAPEEDQYL